MGKFSILSLVTALSVLLCSYSPVSAQTAPDPKETSKEDSVSEQPISVLRVMESIARDARDNADGTIIHTPKIPSLFFSAEDFASLQEARQGFNYKPQAGVEGTELEQLNEGNYIREISLQGILYKSANDWIMWLNQQRMTPKTLPSEIVELKVHKNFVEIKWFDRRTDNVVPIRLRPNQRFNLDAKIFLPGKSDPQGEGGDTGYGGFEPIDLEFF